MGVTLALILLFASGFLAGLFAGAGISLYLRDREEYEPIEPLEWRLADVQWGELGPATGWISTYVAAGEEILVAFDYGPNRPEYPEVLILGFDD